MSACHDLRETKRRFEQEAQRGVCDTGRYRCSYFSWGEGPPLVCVPGLSGIRLGFLQMSGCLAGQFRCISYELATGRGDGARPRSLRHEDLVDDLFALLDHLNIHQAYVLGFSFGSTIALAALRRQAERLLRGILLAGFARRRLGLGEELIARLGRFWPGKMGNLAVYRRMLCRCHSEPFQQRPPESWDFLLELCGSPPASAVLQRTLLMHRLDMTGDLPAIRQPVLLVHGDRDPLVRPEQIDELMRGLPNAGRVEIPGCGHYPLFTHPEALADVVRDFLTPTGPSSGLPSCSSNAATVVQ